MAYIVMAYVVVAYVVMATLRGVGPLEHRVLLVSSLAQRGIAVAIRPRERDEVEGVHVRVERAEL